MYLEPFSVERSGAGDAWGNVEVFLALSFSLERSIWLSFSLSQVSLALSFSLFLSLLEVSSSLYAAN
jgi:hypothetical protein